MSKFKIGDIVVGNDKLLNETIDGRAILKPRKIIGRVEFIYTGNPILLDIKVISGEFIGEKLSFFEERFDLYDERVSRKSFYNDKAVVYFNKDGKKGVAVNTDKKFDLEKGLAFAMLKTFGVTYTQFEEELKKLEKQEMKPKFKKIEVTTMGDDKKQFTKVEKQKDPIEKMIKKFEKGAKNGKSNTN